MVKKVFITAPAKRRLQSLYTFYLSYIPKQKVIKIRDEILSKVTSLESFANRGAIDCRYASSTYQYRFILSNKCKIIYRIENEAVFVVDFFDVRQEPAYKIEE